MIYEEEAHYLLDSNIISEIIKPEPDINVISKIAEHNSDCVICSPVWQEILYGLYRMPEGMNKKFLDNFINDDVHENFRIKNLTEKAAEIPAELRSKLEKKARRLKKKTA